MNGSGWCIIDIDPEIGLRLEIVDRVAALGPAWDPVFAAGSGVQSSRAWFAATEAAALPRGAVPRFVCLLRGDQQVALIPMQVGPGARMQSLTSPYSVLFEPLLASLQDAGAVGLALGRHLRRWPVVLLEALDPAWPGLAPFVAGLRRGGLVVSRFDHFGNWFAVVEGQDWPAYLASRPGALRETIRRRSRAVARDGSVRFEIVRGPDAVDAAMAAYEAVYARSWKVPEPFPDFNVALVRRVAEEGRLVLGLMWRGEVAIAAQYWTVMDGVATVLKLAHDDAFKPLSPGTLLTAHVIRSLLEGGGLRVLDFGRGDDPYKEAWTGERRQRIGLLLANPRRPAGVVAVARHLAGSLRRAIRPAARN